MASPSGGVPEGSNAPLLVEPDKRMQGAALAAAAAANSTETTPLLRRSSVRADEEEGGGAAREGRGGDDEELLRLEESTTWQAEAKTIAAWSVPLVITYLLQRSIYMVSIFVVGRLGTTELGAVSIASITTNMIGNTVIQGLANGLDTLAAQAYGSGHKHLVGLHLQRMCCFVLACGVPLGALWWSAEAALALVLPDADVARLAGLYLRIMTARLPAFTLFECGKRYFQAQGLFYASTYVLALGAPLNALLTWLLVWRWDWGFVGAPIAIVITENFMALLLLVYFHLVDGAQCWGGFTRHAFTRWGPMIRLSVPSMIMQVTEFAAEEVLTIAAAQFGTAHLAAQSALVILVQITYIVPLSSSIASSIRIGNYIGAKCVGPAKLAAKVSVVMGIVMAVVSAVVLVLFRNGLPLLFTTDPVVSRLIIAVIPTILAMQAFDTLAAFSHGLLRGIGQQEIGGYVNLVAYYVFALPISFGTAFQLGWKLTGLWAGMTIGLFMVSVFEFWWLLRSNWHRAVDQAQKSIE